MADSFISSLAIVSVCLLVVHLDFDNELAPPRN